MNAGTGPAAGAADETVDMDDEDNEALAWQGDDRSIDRERTMPGQNHM